MQPFKLDLSLNSTCYAPNQPALGRLVPTILLRGISELGSIQYVSEIPFLAIALTGFRMMRLIL